MDKVNVSFSSCSGNSETGGIISIVYMNLVSQQETAKREKGECCEAGFLGRLTL